MLLALAALFLAEQPAPSARAAPPPSSPDCREITSPTAARKPSSGACASPTAFHRSKNAGMPGPRFGVVEGERATGRKTAPVDQSGRAKADFSGSKTQPSVRGSHFRRADLACPHALG